MGSVNEKAKKVKKLRRNSIDSTKSSKESVNEEAKTEPKSKSINQQTKYIFKCDKCHKIFDSVSDLNIHFTTLHDTDQQFEEKLYNFNKLPEAALYRCLNCPFRTTVSEDMISHHIDNH